MLENDVQFKEVLEKIDIFAKAALDALQKSQVPFKILREVMCEKKQML